MLLPRTIFWISYIFLYLIVLFPVYRKACRFQKQGRTKEFDALVRYQVERWARKLLRHIKIEVQVTGQENLPADGEAVVYVANHQSFLDIPILLSNLDSPHGILAKNELDKIPFLRGWMRLLGCVYVDRDDVRSSIAALKTAENTVKGGKSFILFPEGTRTKTGELGEFKAGAVRIAYKAKAKVIPVAISGSYQLLEKNGFRLKKGQVQLTILPGIETKNLTREEQKALPEALAQQIGSILAQPK